MTDQARAAEEIGDALLAAAEPAPFELVNETAAALRKLRAGCAANSTFREHRRLVLMVTLGKKYNF